MNWLPWIYLRTVLPLTEPRFYGGLMRRWNIHARQERDALEKNLARQHAKLKRILNHAYDTVPFYRQRFDEAGFQPNALRDLDSLKIIPVLTRDDIRYNLEQLRSTNYSMSELLPAATGGTTTTPVPFLRSAESLKEKNAIQLRLNAWAGLVPSQKVFYLWGAVQDFSSNPSWRWRLYDRHLMQRQWAQASKLNDEVLDAYRRQLCNFRPHAIYAYPTPLAVFAAYLRDCGKFFPRPKTIVCTAEPLLDSQRAEIESVFGTKVFEQYGSREFGMIAGECEQHDGLHIDPAAAYVEYAPVEGSDELYQLVITDLVNYGMPLIRYAIGDCAMPKHGTCACGRGYPMLQHLQGRTTDMFYLPDNTIIPGISLTNRVVQVLPGIEQMQIVQETFLEFRIRYVRGPKFQLGDIDCLRSNLLKFLPASTHFTFEMVDQIPREKSGKTRFCICRVPAPVRQTVVESVNPSPPAK